MTPRLHQLKILGPNGFIPLAYAEWGPIEAARTVVCVHGLTRNGRDFDALAMNLAGRGFRVVAPDLPGRGRSGWVGTPAAYGYPLYMAAAVALIARLGTDSVLWVGTSLGGILGMLLAGQAGTPIAGLVINDVGPFIPREALQRIAGYVGADPRFEGFGEVEAYLRRIHAPFGNLTDAQWRHLAAHSAIPAEHGRLKLHYDPAIAVPFAAKELGDAVMWPAWDEIDCPTLVLRGAQSDLLLPDTAHEMTRRGKAAQAGRVRLVEIPDCGHAPALMDEAQIDLVAAFLEQA
ncbi:MAG TPA: alpha/beta hydrolase [Alphaproteobacteria bacterium]